MTASITALFSGFYNANQAIPTPVRYHSIRNLHIEHLTSSAKMEYGHMAQNKSLDEGNRVLPSAIKVLKIRNFEKDERFSNQTR